MSNTAFIYDAVRTPRSKGKPSGTLHEVKPIDLGAGLLNALQERNDLDTSYVDDECVPPNACVNLQCPGKIAAAKKKPVNMNNNTKIKTGKMVEDEQ